MPFNGWDSCRHIAFLIFNLIVKLITKTSPLIIFGKDPILSVLCTCTCTIVQGIWPESATQHKYNTYIYIICRSE